MDEIHSSMEHKRTTLCPCTVLPVDGTAELQAGKAHVNISRDERHCREAILAYSDRHFKRIDKLVQQSYLLDHTIAAMSVLSAPNGTASTDIMTIDMSSSSSDSSSSDSNESSSESSRSSDDESSDVEDSISRNGGANAVNKRAATQASTRSSKRLRN